MRRLSSRLTETSAAPAPAAAGEAAPLQERPAPRVQRVRTALRRVPRPLTALLAVVAIFGATWSLLPPPWQAPDEDAHFAYVQSLGERGDLPGTAGRLAASTEQTEAAHAMNNDETVFLPDAKPEWSAVADRAWGKRDGTLPRDDGGGPAAASSYPPAYYLYETVPYLAAKSGGIFGRLYLMRLASALWLLVTTTAVWLLAGEVFGRRRVLQLAAAAVVGLWPMLDFISASVNPDAMLYAEWALALWLGVSLLTRGLERNRAIAFGAVVGLALVTKSTSLALVPAAVFVLGVAAWRSRPRLARSGAVLAAVGLLALATPLVAWVGTSRALHRSAYAQLAEAGHSQTSDKSAGGAKAAADGGGSPTAPASKPLNIREFASYVWQFYLPRLSFMTPLKLIYPVISTYPAYNVWLGTGWATFGWVNVWFAREDYRIFLVATLLILLAALVATARRRGRPLIPRPAPTTLAILAFFALAAVALLVGLHWSEYRSRAPFLQGRYLFPLAGIGGLVFAQAISAFPRRWRGPALAVSLTALVLFQVACLALVTVRYYA